MSSAIAVRMPRHLSLVLALIVAGSGLKIVNADRAGNDPTGTGSIESLQIESLMLVDGVIAVTGADATVQILATGLSAGQPLDLTRMAEFTIEPPDLATIDSTGLISPLRDGDGILRGRTHGLVVEQPIRCDQIAHQADINFANEVVPILTRYGCNGGGCHGKSGGQNGFRLSLLGFEPADDYQFLLHEAHSRRIFPAAPDQSLLLRKATGSLPHGGGARFDRSAPAYRILRRWIAQGVPYGKASDPVVERVEILPQAKTLTDREQQQLAVIAHYSDGTRADVTRMSHFASNASELAEVNESGLVTAGSRTGRAAVMARFQTHVDVFRVTVPLGQPVAEEPAGNLIDRFVLNNLKQLGLPPSPLADDATFLRRVTLDVAGRLPTLAEAEAFLASTASTKREAIVDRLLASSDYADFFAKKWADILRNRREEPSRKPITFAFHAWLRRQLIENRPYDAIVRDILAASGPVETTPAVAWYHAVDQVEEQVEDTAQLFLGMRIQCARCHHHPHEKWSQADYYGLAAFFSQVGRKAARSNARHFNVFHRAGHATSKHPKSGDVLVPTPLGAAPLQLADTDDPRHRLADWLSRSDNPFFSQALVNRYWKHFLGRGLVEPEDDMRVTNPPSNPELLNGMAEYFVASGFDLKGLVRLICTSRTYQRSSLPNAFNQQDEQNYSRFLPRRLPAEVLSDSIDAVTKHATQYGGVPSTTRAVQLPDSGFDSYFLTVFGRPEGESACECERSSEVSLAQTLHLINSKFMQTKLQEGRAKELAKVTKEEGQIAQLHDLYTIAFSRPPTSSEQRVALAYLKEKSEAPQDAYEDLLWAVLNTKEFLFNH